MRVTNLSRGSGVSNMSYRSKYQIAQLKLGKIRHRSQLMIITTYVDNFDADETNVNGGAEEPRSGDPNRTFGYPAKPDMIGRYCAQSEMDQ